MSLPAIASIRRRIERLEAAMPSSNPIVVLAWIDRILRMDEAPSPDDTMHADGLTSERGETLEQFARRVARHRGQPASNVHAILACCVESPRTV